MYSIILSNKAKKFLGKTNPLVYSHILSRIRKLSFNPLPKDAKKMRGNKIYRVRCGRYRILYVVVFDKKEIVISKIDKRSRVYKR